MDAGARRTYSPRVGISDSVKHPGAIMTVQDVRAFNRFYTGVIGALDYGRHLYAPYTLTETRVLYELAQAPHLDAAELRTGLDLDAGYLSRILNRFEDAGLIERGPRRAIRAAWAGTAYRARAGDRRTARRAGPGDRRGPARHGGPRRPAAAGGGHADHPGRPRRGAHRRADPVRRGRAARSGPRRPRLDRAAQRRAVRGRVRLERRLRGAGGPDRQPASRRTTTRVWSGCGSPSRTGGRWAV